MRSRGTALLALVHASEELERDLVAQLELLRVGARPLLARPDRASDQGSEHQPQQQRDPALPHRLSLHQFCTLPHTGRETAAGAAEQCLAGSVRLLQGLPLTHDSGGGLALNDPTVGRSCAGRRAGAHLCRESASSKRPERADYPGRRDVLTARGVPGLAVTQTVPEPCLQSGCNGGTHSLTFPHQPRPLLAQYDSLAGAGPLFGAGGRAMHRGGESPPLLPLPSAVSVFPQGVETALGSLFCSWGSAAYRGARTGVLVKQPPPRYPSVPVRLRAGAPEARSRGWKPWGRGCPNPLQRTRAAKRLGLQACRGPHFFWHPTCPNPVGADAARSDKREPELVMTPGKEPPCTPTMGADSPCTQRDESFGDSSKQRPTSSDGVGTRQPARGRNAGRKCARHSGVRSFADGGSALSQSLHGNRRLLAVAGEAIAAQESWTPALKGPGLSTLQAALS